MKRPKKSKYIFKSPWKRMGARLMDGMGQGVRLAKRRRPWDLSGVQRVLVVRMDQIGDAIFSEPAVEYLHELLPKASIDFLAGPWSAPLVHNFPYVSQTLVFQNNWYDPQADVAQSARNARAMVRTLRQNPYDLGIDLRGDIRNIVLLRAALTKRILGYGITGGKFLLDRCVPYDFSAHQVDLNLRLVAEVARGVKGASHEIPTKEHRRPRLFCPDALKEAVSDRFGPRGQRPRVLVHMEAGYPSKRWKKENFTKLLKSLCAYPIQIVLIGTEAMHKRDPSGSSSPQDDIIPRNDSDYSECGPIIDLRGKTNLLELCGLIAQSDLLIGNDSAPAHIAASLGTPCVVLFSGANDPSRWRPLGNNVHLLFHPIRCSPCESRECRMPTHECMDAIAVSKVEGLVHDVLIARGCLV